MFNSEAFKIVLLFELCNETIERDGKTAPISINKEYTLSLGKKSVLRKHLETWRGRPFTDEELKGFEVGKKAFMDFNSMLEQSAVSIAAQEKMLKGGKWDDAMKNAMTMMRLMQLEDSTSEVMVLGVIDFNVPRATDAGPLEEFIIFCSRLNALGKHVATIMAFPDKVRAPPPVRRTVRHTSD
jgi:hypothetical protein